jgi:Right handed beta helix region
VHSIKLVACCVTIWATVSSDSRAAPPEIVVAPATDLARLVAGAPPDTSFVLLPGRHYSGNIKPKDGQIFEGQPGAVLSGAVQLGPFAYADHYWKALGPPPLPPSHGTCNRRTAATADACLLREALFIDGTPLTRALTIGNLGEGNWFQNRVTGDVLLAFDPGKRLVELTYRTFAFYGRARNITIRHLVVEQFASTAQQGAIEGSSSSGWTVVDSDVRFNSGVGISTGNFMRVQSNHIWANGQLGIGGRGTNLIVEANDIAANNTHAFDPGWEAGGTKFALTENLIFVRNCVHDNKGAGIWTDINNRNASIIGNWSIKNSGVGISHEISGRAIIANNVSALNGSWGNSPWASQILVSGSINTLVWHNQVLVAPNYGQGIFVVEEGRSNVERIIHDLPEYVSRANEIIANEITYSGTAGESGYFSSNGDASALASVNRFEDNNITVNEGGLRRFKIGRERMNLPEAQERGQELRSRILQTRSGDFQNISRFTCPLGIGPR